MLAKGGNVLLGTVPAGFAHELELLLALSWRAQ